MISIFFSESHYGKEKDLCLQHVAPGQGLETAATDATQRNCISNCNMTRPKISSETALGTPLLPGRIVTGILHIVCLFKETWHNR